MLHLLTVASAFLSVSVAALDLSAVPRQLRQATRDQVVARLSPRRVLAPRASPIPCSSAVRDADGQCCPVESKSTSSHTCIKADR